MDKYLGIALYPIIGLGFGILSIFKPKISYFKEYIKKAIFYVCIYSTINNNFINNYFIVQNLPKL